MPFVQHGPQDYQCPVCGHIERDVRADWREVPEERRLYKGQEEKMPVYCPACRATAPLKTVVLVGTAEPIQVREERRVEMVWLPVPTANDLTSGGTGLHVDLGDAAPRRFDSFREMHRYEQESLKRAAGGDGSPQVFRALHQSRQNMREHTLTGSAFERNRQIPHDQIGKSRGKHLGRGVMSRSEAERHGTP